MNGNNYGKNWDKKARQLTVDCVLERGEAIDLRIHLLEGFVNAPQSKRKQKQEGEEEEGGKKKKKKKKRD